MKRLLLILLIPCYMLLQGCTGKHKTLQTDESTFYPPLPQQPRLQYLTTINSNLDIEESRSGFAQFVLGDVAPHTIIHKPYDIGSSPGKIYILDRRVKKLLIIDLAARTFEYLDDKRMGALLEPSGIWISENDHKYIADMRRKQIIVFDNADRYVRSYGNKEMFDKPVDVTVDDKRLYVCDMDGNRIAIIDKNSGELIKYFSTLMSDDKRLYKPTHINLDRFGNLFINDAFNYQIQRFSRDGEHLGSFGFHGDIVGSLARPKGIAIDRSNHLYAVDAAFENVQIFDVESTKVLLFFGGAGNTPANMYLPSGIHIDYENAAYFSEFADKDFHVEYVVYVTNMFGANKLNVYGFGTWKGDSVPLK